MRAIARNKRDGGRQIRNRSPPEHLHAGNAYLPYVIVDGNAGVDIAGKGEIETRRYAQGSGDKKVTCYDADVYQVERHVDFKRVQRVQGDAD